MNDDPETLAALAAIGHELQERLACHEAWISTDSTPVIAAGQMNLGPWGPGAAAAPVIAELQGQFAVADLVTGPAGHATVAKVVAGVYFLYQVDCYRRCPVDPSNLETDFGSVAGFLIPGVLVPLVFLALAFWQPTPRQVLRWGAVCDVSITDRNREQVRSHLARVRRFRSIAAFPFWWLVSIRVVYADFPSALASPLPALAAYVAGGLLAEATSATPEASSPVRQATLLPRAMTQYVPRWTRVLPWSLVLVGAAATVLGRNVDSVTSTRHAALVLILAVLLATAAEGVGRHLVHRPQRGVTPDVLAADDGLRAAGISSAGAAAGLAGLMAAWTGLSAATPQSGALGLLVLPVSLVAQGLAIGLLCCIVRQESWGYQRRHRQPTSVATPA